MFRNVLFNALILGFATANPVAKVQELLQDLQAEKQKESEAGDAANKKYQCWCKTNREEKTTAIENSDQTTKSLLATAKRLKSQAEEADEARKVAEAKMEEISQNMKKSAAVRSKEAESFNKETQTLRENIAGLGQALVALRDNVEVNAKPRQFLQVQSAVESARPMGAYARKMQTDLLEVLAAFPSQKQQLRGDSIALASAQPMNSYGSQSGHVVGMLEQLESEMKEEFSKAEEAENAAIESFKKQQASMMREHKAQKSTYTKKSTLYAESLEGAAQANEQAGIQGRMLQQNTKFLAALETTCKEQNEMYSSNVKARNQELKALGEALGVLREDDVRDMFGPNAPSFLQVKQFVLPKLSKEQVKAARALRKTGSLQLLQLAGQLGSSSGLPQFNKLFEKFDNMVVHLKEQMKNEFNTRDLCNSAIHENKVLQGDLGNTLANLELKIDKNEKDIEGHKANIEDQSAAIEENHNNIQKASDTREEQNVAFQAAQDNGMKVSFVLKKVLNTLSTQYAAKSLIQTSAPGGFDFGDKAPPSQVATATKNGAAGGVLTLLQEIASDNQAALNMGVTDENKYQAEYAEFLQNSFDSVNDSSETIDNLSNLMVSVQGRLDDAKTDQSTTVSLAFDAAKAGKDKIEECSFLLKYFDLRQQKMQEEIDAIGEAKAILSGAQ